MPALTLSGAAEEILGKALSHKDIENSLEELFDIYNRPGLSRLNPKKDWGEFTINGHNKVGNSIKHFKNINELYFEADIEDEAIWMLSRACENYSRLGFPPTMLMTEFENWFFENSVGD